MEEKMSRLALKLSAFAVFALVASSGSSQASSNGAIPRSIPIKKDANGCYSPDPGWTAPGGGPVTYNPPPPWCGSVPNVTVCFKPSGCYKLTLPDGTIGPLNSIAKPISVPAKTIYNSPVIIAE
jgi:hypothetical protein